MSDESKPVEEQQEVPVDAEATNEESADTATATDPPTEAERGDEATASQDVGEVRVPEFATLQEGAGKRAEGNMDRFLDVRVTVCAELGRVDLPLGELVELAEGTVMRLDRPVSEPVDVVSQGVKLARGEVIVIDDCFAIRIKEIVAKK